MKHKKWIALALLMSVGVTDVSALGFLKQLEKSVKKEVGNRVKKEVDKIMDKGVAAMSDNNKQQSQSTQSPQSTQSSPSPKRSSNKPSYNQRRAQITIIPPMEEYAPSQGKLNGHKWVDLGLPSGLKWAICNLGADAVDEYGDYYSWGGTVRWYAKDRERGSRAGDEVQKDISGDARYDAATAHWGTSWCMPSADDFAELIENCTWEMTQIGRRKGLKVTSKHNGKYIFLPTSGETSRSSDFYKIPDEVNKKLIYWISSPELGSDVRILRALENEVALGSASRRTTGYPIRPVMK